MRIRIPSLALGLGAALLLPAPALTQVQPHALEAPHALLETLGLKAATVQDLKLPMTGYEPFDVRVVLGGTERTLELAPRSVRAPGFKVFEIDEHGPREVEAPPPSTYAGVVQGDPTSTVGASLVDGQLQATVLTRGGAWTVQPAVNVMAGMPWSAHVVYDQSDVLPTGLTCATETLPVPPAQQGGPAAAGGVSEAEIIIDCSSAFRNLNGGTRNGAVNQATSMLASVNAIYQRDVNITHTIRFVFVRTGNFYTSSNPQTILNQFQNFWNQFPFVDRDVMQLLMGFPQSGTIGISYLGTVCNKSFAYGVSWWSSNFTVRVAVMAHELGHSWNAIHCGGGGCRIMCPSIGGCSGNITSFGNQSINAITSFAASRGCLN